jgi:uncharacterized protein
MRRLLFASLSGALFGTGLMLSGMTNTLKVQGWLDVFGDWDPTLAFVMGGGLLPMIVAWRIAAKRPTALLGTPIPRPSATQVDWPLVFGSVIFGAGWALAGLCPGPAMASLGYGGWGGLVFLIAMLAGMVAAPAARRRLDALTA